MPSRKLVFLPTNLKRYSNSVEYSVVIHRAEEGGYWVEVPALPACYSQGETVDEALSNAREAIGLYLEALREEGREAPKDEDVVFRVAVAV